ncbi:MAG: uroporphyrinogen-III synthase [Deltaproteobacteria bacterium]|nr:uroporphyrinogen-III synthase [Deltaproteobacteria bacterium]
MIAAIGTTTAKRLAQAGLPADVVPAKPDVGQLVAALARATAERTGRRG